MKVMVLDIGGTSIKSAVYQDGELADVQECASDAGRGGSCLMRKAEALVRRYQERHSFDKIGISTTGQVDPVEGRILYANDNVPGYTGMRVRQLMEETFGLPVVVENDVNAAGIGEAVFGAGIGQRDFLCMTFGTGIGGAVFLDGRLYRGSSFSAGEFGAMTLYSGGRKAEEDRYERCYEKSASAAALVERARRVCPQLTDGRAVFASLGHENVRRIVDEWIGETAVGIVTLIHIFNPAAVILGGGVMEQDYAFCGVRERVYGKIMPSFRNVDIRKAALGNRAGMYGIGAAAEGNLSCLGYGAGPDGHNRL